MADTLFTVIQGTASDANDTDPENSASFVNPPIQAKHNVTSMSNGTDLLDTSDTLTLTVPAVTSSSWICLMVRVIGHAKVTTVGVDWDGSTPIEGITAGFGTIRHPGYISMVTKNVTSFTLTALADDTEVEYLMATLAEDDQL